MSDESNSSGREEDAALGAEYVLGLLSSEEHARVAERARTDAALRSDLRFWRTRFSQLDDGFAETPAPANVWHRLEQRLFAEQSRPGFWNSLALWRSLASAAALVAIVAIGVNIATPRPDPTAFAAQLVAALAQDGSNVSMVALYNASTGQVRLTSLSGAPVADKDYELWAIEGTDAPKSMGVIPVDARVDVKVAPDVLAGFGAGTILAITLEQKGGSPTGAPQGPIVAKGAATQI
jgi:anti-sigma-K factor RskA